MAIINSKAFNRFYVNFLMHPKVARIFNRINIFSHFNLKLKTRRFFFNFLIYSG